MQKEYKGTAFSADVGDEKHHVIDQANSLIGSWNSGDDCKSRAQLYILFANALERGGFISSCGASPPTFHSRLGRTVSHGVFR
jgi:hypothetical protein